MFKLDLEKAEEPEIKLPTSAGSLKKQESFRKTSTSALLTMPKPLIQITTNWKIPKEMGIPDHLTCLLWNLHAGQEAAVRIGHEQWTSSTLGKEHIKAVYCHSAYLTYMQSTSCKMAGWMKHKLKSRLQGEISITSDMHMTPPSWQKERRTKEPLDESERGEWKSWLKVQHSEN